MKLEIYLKSGKAPTVFVFEYATDSMGNKFEGDIKDLYISENLTYQFIGKNQVVVNGSEISFIELS
ncbi:hypothetical protein P7H90_09270 [Lactococcus lactis]|uniref:hypothetical protein n=1 Tax=Lactococcus lactis TaxID=1358 RepID=UPI0028913C61|nr:hypothetical protein [Lactococcus lactis]MDT2877233.1 hypothetical protein [Lactococcus lactis]MDT2893454.1 hypothetical protein [Lactococcus lactis]MDT2919471.1 hypothetical protein [Lactococcus lactis]